MENKKTTYRELPIAFRVSQKEKEILNEWADKNHIGLSPLVRFSCLKLAREDLKE